MLFPILIVSFLPAAEAEPHGMLSLTITNVSGTPLAGASVKAARIRDGAMGEGQTGLDGACKLDLPIGTYCLTVRAQGYDPDFTGGVAVRARSDFPLHFMLAPGDANKKLPHEKTPAERAEELAKLQAKKGQEAAATPQTVLQSAYEGLDEACKSLQIERTLGGPASRNGLASQGLKLAQKRQFQEALEMYKRALGEDATDSGTWFNAGVLYGFNKQVKPSETCFRTAIALCGGGGDSDYHAYLGRTLGLQGRVAEAEKCFHAAILIDPKEEPRYLYETGWAYHHLKNFEKAVPLFAQAIAKGYDDPSVFFAHANALSNCRRNAESIAQYKIYLEKAGKNPEEAQYVAIAKEQIEKLSKAPMK